MPNRQTSVKIVNSSDRILISSSSIHAQLNRSTVDVVRDNDRRYAEIRSKVKTSPEWVLNSTDDGEEEYVRVSG